MFRPLAAWMTRRIAALPDPGAACRICARWPSRTFCDDCLQRFARPTPRCPRCALPLPAGQPGCGACLRRPPPLAACVAALPYGFPWDRSIGALKFHGDAGLAGALARLLAAAPGADALLAASNRLVPVPLSDGRLRERGFNQAALLAGALAPRRCDTASLLRIRHTPALSGLNRAGRQAQVRGAFAVEPGRAADLAGRRILLVDDVMTSGATLHEAARVLLAAGAATVSALVLARTGFD